MHQEKLEFNYFSGRKELCCNDIVSQAQLQKIEAPQRQKCKYNQFFQKIRTNQGYFTTIGQDQTISGSMEYGKIGKKESSLALAAGFGNEAVTFEAPLMPRPSERDGANGTPRRAACYGAPSHQSSQYFISLAPNSCFTWHERSPALREGPHRRPRRQPALRQHRHARLSYIKKNLSTASIATLDYSKTSPIIQHCRARLFCFQDIHFPRSIII